MFEYLEKLILKYRTNEMMRIIFHTEDLRKFLISSMKASNLTIKEHDKNYFHGKDKVMPQVWRRLINDEILTISEVEDLKKLLIKEI